MHGITVQNSPSWTIHPYFSKHLKFIDVKILNPANSHNTDGLDPESCQDVLVLGPYKSGALARFHMLEFYYLKNIAIYFNCNTIPEITCRNHKKSSS